MKEKIIKNKPLLAFILSFFLGLIIVLPFIIMGKGMYYVDGDFFLQQVPFNMMLNNSIKNGSFLWTWFNDLGSNFIGTFSFYNLLSPFNIIGYLFPADLFPYLIGPIYILKYAVAGLTSYLYLKRYVKNQNYAILGSLLYTFSGFQLTNIMFYHFHDVVALFPLMLYTLDNLIYENKKGRFALAVAINALTNWFFFIGEVVFTIIYFIIKVITKDYKITIKKFIQTAFEGLIGTLLTFFVLLPTLLFTISNPRVEGGWTIRYALKYTYFNYIEILKSFIMPADTLINRALIQESNFCSTELYLPVIALAYAITYAIKKPKNWTSILTIISIIFMFTPILNSAFYLFTSAYYTRWVYMLTLILSLMSIKSLEENQNCAKGIIIQFILYIILIILLIFYKQKIIYNIPNALLLILFTIINLLLTIYINTINSKKLKLKLLYIVIIIFIALYGNFITLRYKNKAPNYEEYYTYIYDRTLNKYQNTRTNSDFMCKYNLGYTNLINNIKTFNSNINGSAFKFYNSINTERDVTTVIKETDNDLNDFLGVKYIIDCNIMDLEKYGYTLIETSKNYKIYENTDYKEFGFSPKEYISTKEFKKLNESEKKKTLKEKIVLNTNQIKKYKDLYIDKEYTYDVEKFKYIKNGFISKINSSKETIAIYQIPYDEGWKATINGKETKIEEVDFGMIGIKINKGQNNIKFKYYPKGLNIGLLISLISLLIYILYQGGRNEKTSKK